MLTQTQIRTEVYNALNVTAINAIVGTRIYWINRITVDNTFPLITYSLINLSGDYAFGIVPSAEDVTVQVDLYVSPEEITQMDSLAQLVKTSMEAIDYRQTTTSGEYFDAETNKNIVAIRFERVNA